MPTKEVWVTPDRVLTHKGITIFNTYGDDDINNGPSRYYFTTSPTSDEHWFDVRELDVPSKSLLDNHPPYLSDTNPLYAKASAEQKAEWKLQWEEWNKPGGGEAQSIHAVLKDAIDAGLIAKSEDQEVASQRQITLAVSIKLCTSEVDLEEIKYNLQQLGDVQFNFESEVELQAPAQHGREVCLYRTHTGTFPDYLHVSMPGVSSGPEISEDEFDTLMKEGVCVELHGGNPKANKVGLPRHATTEEVAAAFASELGFKVTTNSLVANLNGCGRDDLYEGNVWLKLVIPE